MHYKEPLKSCVRDRKKNVQSGESCEEIKWDRPARVLLTKEKGRVLFGSQSTSNEERKTFSFFSTVSIWEVDSFNAFFELRRKYFM